MDSRVSLAARNNALWCDGMCRAHGVQTEITEKTWICRGQPPRFHSQLTTLQPGVQGVVEKEMPGGFKDGFYDIDATPWGHSLIFEASWIWRESSPAGETRVEWRRAQSDAELLVWEAGWAVGDEEASRHPRQFPPSLLADDANGFWGAYEGDRLVAGCILNLTPPVVGVSNVFAVNLGLAELWADIPSVAANAYRGHALVGYERGLDLEAALGAGFQDIGKLRVWVK